MEFQARKIEEKDYDLLVSWWKEWGWDAVPKDMLPSNGDDGIMLEKHGTVSYTHLTLPTTD